MNLVGDSVEQAVHAPVAGQFLIVEVLRCLQVERTEGCGCQVVLRINGLSNLLAGLRILRRIGNLQAGAVELHALHDGVHVAGNPFNLCSRRRAISKVLEGIPGSTDGIGHSRVLECGSIYSSHVGGRNRCNGLVEGVVSPCLRQRTGVAELQECSALLDGSERNERLFVLRVDDGGLQTGQVGGVRVDGHVNLARIVVLEHQRNVGGILEYFYAVNHVHICLGECLFRTHIVTTLHGGELDVSLRPAVEGNQNIGLNIGGQAECAEPGVVRTVNLEACHLSCQVVLDGADIRLQGHDVLHSGVEVLLGCCHALLQVLYIFLDGINLVADGRDCGLQVLDVGLVGADSVEDALLELVELGLVELVALEGFDVCLHRNDVSQSTGNVFLDFINLLLEVIVLAFASCLFSLNQSLESFIQIIQVLGSSIVEAINLFLQCINLFVDELGEVFLGSGDIALSSSETVQNLLDCLLSCFLVAGAALDFCNLVVKSLDGIIYTVEPCLKVSNLQGVILNLDSSVLEQVVNLLLGVVVLEELFYLLLESCLHSCCLFLGNRPYLLQADGSRSFESSKTSLVIIQLIAQFLQAVLGSFYPIGEVAYSACQRREAVVDVCDLSCVVTYLRLEVADSRCQGCDIVLKSINKGIETFDSLLVLCVVSLECIDDSLVVCSLCICSSSILKSLGNVGGHRCDSSLQLVDSFLVVFNLLLVSFNLISQALETFSKLLCCIGSSLSLGSSFLCCGSVSRSLICCSLCLVCSCLSLVCGCLSCISESSYFLNAFQCFCSIVQSSLNISLDGGHVCLKVRKSLIDFSKFAFAFALL